MRVCGENLQRFSNIYITYIWSVFCGTSLYTSIYVEKLPWDNKHFEMTKIYYYIDLEHTKKNVIDDPSFQPKWDFFQSITSDT